LPPRLEMVRNVSASSNAKPRIPLVMAFLS
jgi:hypothetical protein